jgi:pimeloyl-ACP methyl ester carboxylesterase
LLVYWVLANPVVLAGGPWEWGAVFVAPGAGDFRMVDDNLRAVLKRANAPLRVVLVNWSKGGVITDVCDRANHQAAGRALACRVLQYRQWNPGGKVYLLSHSAGAAVVLAATCHLPPDSVDRIILMAPGVSSTYDLGPALTASRLGIESFYSRSDGLLDAAADSLGTTDGRGPRTAGEIGFTVATGSSTDLLLYQKLRQHPWRPEYADLGYYGGHFGLVRKSFLSHCVLPFLITEW